MGRRVRKQVYDWISSAWSLSKDTKFVYDGWNLLLELNGLSSDAVLRKYTWGLDLSGQAGNNQSRDRQGAIPGIHAAGGIGGLLAMHDAGTSTNHWYFYNANGDIGQLVDSSSGNFSAKYQYYPYGGELQAVGAYATTNPFRFSTKFWDAEQQAYYYGFRYHKPKLGRWINRDPLLERGLILAQATTHSVVTATIPFRDSSFTGLPPNTYTAVRLSHSEQLYTYGEDTPTQRSDALGLQATPARQCMDNGNPVSLRFDGSRLGDLDGVSGRPIREAPVGERTIGDVRVITVDLTFDYTKTNQGVRNAGPIPEGHYWFDICSEANWSNAWRHILNTGAWGGFSWPLNAYPGTNTYGRGGLFIHGGQRWGSAGCIDVCGNDAALHETSERLRTANCGCCYIDVIVAYRDILAHKREDRFGGFRPGPKF